MSRSKVLVGDGEEMRWGEGNVDSQRESAGVGGEAASVCGDLGQRLESNATVRPKPVYYSHA